MGLIELILVVCVVLVLAGALSGRPELSDLGRQLLWVILVVLIVILLFRALEGGI